MAASPTRVESVYRAIRADVLRGHLRPGERLRFTDLGLRYEASQGVLREGLSRLVAEGLVVSEPQLGFRVVTLSRKDLTDLTEARCQIEGAALRDAIAHGDLAWEAAVVASHHVLERTTDPPAMFAGRPGDSWSTAHQAFHEALLAGCANGRIVAIAVSLRASAEVYRWWSGAVVGVERDVDAEHRSLATACLNRDPDLAVELLRSHLWTTAELLLAGATLEREGVA